MSKRPRKTGLGETLDIERILVAVDGSPDSERGVSYAMKIARSTDAKLTILNVLPSITTLGVMASRAPLPQATYDEFYRIAEKESKEMVSRGVSLAQSRGVKAKGEVIRSSGTIVTGIVDFARKDKTDLIVIGTRGLGGFKRLLLGSVSTGVVTHAQCAVLVVR